MHGHLSEQRHMWSVPDSSFPNFFSKDGRKISNGDCALFQAGNAPPFIGIIRHQIVDEKGDVKLGVNWLYRPADVKLGKGVPIQEALPPNEIFYSFHKDEISSASLLHPCKVAFLSKGVQLPSGVSSFVCRRVYDTNSKCLWWLTDRDYTNEHQEEVDRLLDKTRHEMQATVQSGGPSPMIVNVPAQLKSSLDNIQNALFPSQVKGKRRERADQSMEPVKRSCSSKPEDGDAMYLKRECNMRPEAVRNINNKNGALISSAGVEQLVHIMQQDRVGNIKKGTDSASQRTMLVGILATTDQDDCLNRFVKLGGLSILDDWLQEAHRGKSGDCGSPKEGDKVSEDLLVMLLQVLDRLPVDLEALKTCNIGKSVNHLRSHKNSEIQKKARSLVDLWKKRVEEEMKNNDINSGPGQGVSWPCKHALGEVLLSHGNKGEGSAEMVSKSLAPLASSSKAASNSVGRGDMAKTTSASPGSVKLSIQASLTDSSKDSLCRVPVCSGIADLLAAATKEEKTSSSSHSQNNTKTSSSGPGNPMCSVWKEDAGSLSAKASHSGSSHKISRLGILGSGMSGSLKETVGGKPAAWSRSVPGEKASHSGPISDKGTNIGCRDNANAQRLIIRLPNPARSPAVSVNSGMFPDTAVLGSQEPSPGKNEKHKMTDKKAKALNTVFHDNSSPEVDIEPWQSSDGKDELIKGGDRERSTSAITIEEHFKNDDKTEKMLEACGTSQIILLSGSGEQKVSAEAEIGKPGEPVAVGTGLIEGCSIHSEATPVAMDECGMNLLASVAVSEMSKVQHTCTVGNTETTSLAAEEENLDDETKLNYAAKASPIQPNDDARAQIAFDLKKQRDGGDCKDYPDASRNAFFDECSKNKSIAQNKDALEISNMASDSGFVADVGHINGPSNVLATSFSCTGLLSENSTTGGMGECPSIQDVEQSREVDCMFGEKMDVMEKDGIFRTPMELDSVYAEPFTDQEMGDGGGVHGSHEIGKRDNKGQSQLHGKNSSAGGDGASGDEILLEGDNKEEDAENQEKMVVERVAGITAPDYDVREPIIGSSELHDEDASEMACEVAKEVEREIEHCGKQPVYSKVSDKGGQDLSLVHHFRNERAKDSDLIDGGEQQCNSGGGVEDKGKGQSAGGKDLAISRSTTDTDNGQETVDEKTEHMEAEQKVGSEEGNEVDKEIVAARTESGLPDTCDDMRKVPIKGCELSGQLSNFDHARLLRVESNSPTALTQQTSQTETFMTQIVQLNKGDVDEQITTTVVGTEKVNGCSDMTIRPHFDLNEGVAFDETIQDDAMISTPASAFQAMPFSIASVSLPTGSSCLATPVAVVAATKGPFEPPVNALRSIGELGWKGSAATSAFRPAQPRRTPKWQHSSSESAPLDALNSTMGKQSGVLLDIDLNVADERAFEDAGMPIHLSSQPSETVTSSQQRHISDIDFMASTGEQFTCVGPSLSPSRLDLDLNRTDENEEKETITVPPGRSDENFESSLKAFTSGLSNGASHVFRDFDLNDGPSLEDSRDELRLQNLSAKSNISSSLPSVTGLRMNGNVLDASSWFSQGNTFPALALPSYSSARMEQPYPVVAAAAVQSILSSLPGSAYCRDSIYKGGLTMFSSDPTISFSNTTLGSFPFAGFPFGLNFPFSSASFPGGSMSYLDSLGSLCYPAAPSQIVTAEPLSSSYVKPYLMSLSEVSGTASTSTSTWQRPNLDLNAGPEAVDMEARKDRITMRQPSINGQVSLEEQVVFCQRGALGVPLKRKDPEGGVWDMHRSGYKQSTWRWP